MPRIEVQGEKSFEVADGARLVRAIEDNGIDILHRCGGYAKCTTCRVEFVEGEPARMTQAEHDRLEKGDLLGKVRLSCQILCEHDMKVHVVNRLSVSGLPDPGPQPEAYITPEPQWMDAVKSDENSSQNVSSRTGKKNMFTTEQRDYVRDRVLNLARTDPRVTGGALTGSSALGVEDEWSDVDVAFGITEDITPEAVLNDWTEALDRELGALHHWDLRSGSSVYRVFLLPTGIEVDVGVSPQKEFGARGPQFRAIFGTTNQVDPSPQPDAQHLVGLGWHHVLHARSSIERGKSWRAEYWISAIRDHTLTLACLRLGEDAMYARGVDRLPATITGPLAEALVYSLDEAELRRALAAATACFISELEALDAVLCVQLKPLLQEFGAPQAVTEPGHSPRSLVEQ